MRFVLLAVLASCAPAVTSQSSTPRTVKVDHVTPSNLGEAMALAQQQCDQNGQDAELVSTPAFTPASYRDVSLAHFGKTIAFVCVDRVVSTQEATPNGNNDQPAAAAKRAIVNGHKPLFCASTAADVGLCFFDENACTAEREKSGAPTCEVTIAGSCFNKTRTLDGRKVTTCAISIKDCEARRALLATDPDYSVTGCGIYRQAAN